MKETLNEILQRMLATVDAGVAFLSEEIPEVVNQLLLWHLVENLLLFLVGVIGIILCVIGAKKVCSLAKIEAEAYLLLIPLGFVSVFIGCSFIVSINWLKILIAPKLYLIEYAASLVK